MTESIKFVVCILGAVSLYIGLVSLLKDYGFIFIATLPLNAAFVWWYSNQNNRDNNAKKSV